MANIPTVSHNEGTPAGSNYIREGDDRIREFKTQVREIVGVDHKFDSSGQGATWGMHKWVTLIESADIGSGASGLPILGAQTVVKPELMYTDEDDNDVQLTSGGKSFANLLEDGAALVTSAAPSTDAMVANKKYVDDQVALLPASILDYGTSASTSSAKTLPNVHICYGTVSVAASRAITNLPFTSKSTYSAVAQADHGSDPAAKVIRAVKDSGAQLTIYNPTGTTMNFNWIAIGT